MASIDCECGHDAWKHRAVNDPNGPSGQLGRCEACDCDRYKRGR